MSQERAHGRLGAGERLMLLDIADRRMPSRQWSRNAESLIKRGMLLITDTQVVKHPHRAYCIDDYALTPRGKHSAEQLRRRFHELRPRPGSFLDEWEGVARWVYFHAKASGYVIVHRPREPASRDPRLPRDCK